jgi:hypothetical protein
MTDLLSTEVRTQARTVFSGNLNRGVSLAGACSGGVARFGTAGTASGVRFLSKE